MWAVDWGPIIAVLGGVVAVWLLLLALLWLLRPRDARLRELIRLLPDVLRLGRQLVADRSVAWGVRLALVGLVAWLLNPIDLVPEFIPLLGPLDDVVVAVLVLRYVWRRVGDAELRRRWPGTADGYALLSATLGHNRAG
jgi:uncharacterized membrane protein YkvA (DUF1232 family)